MMSFVEGKLALYMSDERIIERTRDCYDYFANKVNAVADFGPPTNKEKSLPIAYGIMVHSKVIAELF